jgi:hypothetical protein
LDGESLCAKGRALLLTGALVSKHREVGEGEGESDTAGLIVEVSIQSYAWLIELRTKPVVKPMM